MKLTRILTIFISSCVLVCDCDQQEFPSRGSSRKSRLERSGPIKAPQDASVQDVLLLKLVAIEEMIERSAGQNLNILSRLEELDGKIDKINEQLFIDEITDQSKLSVVARLVLCDKKIDEIDHKISRLINQSVELSDRPLHVTLSEALPSIDAGIVAEQLKESIAIFEGKILENLSENAEKLEYLKRYLQAIFDENVNKNNSRDDSTMQIQRKERRIEGNTGLMNEILSMVKERLKSDEEDDLKKISETVRSLTDMVSNFEHMKTTTTFKKNKTTPGSRHIIFPHIRNKPSKLNTTFMSEAFGNKDIRVSA